MRYHHRIGATQKQSSNKRWLVGVPFLALLVGGYVTINMNAPLLQGIDGRSSEATAQKLLSVQPGKDGNRLYIPQINIDIPIAEGADTSALEYGAAHSPEGKSTPDSSGMFVLGARHLRIGMTPAETKTKSPFYHLDKLQPGDELFVDWQGKRYVYEVKKQVMVDDIAALPQTASEGGAPSLALYTATEDGDLERDVAVKAERVGTVAWGKKPIIQRSTNPESN